MVRWQELANLQKETPLHHAARYSLGDIDIARRCFPDCMHCIPVCLILDFGESGFGARGCFWRDGVGTRTLRCLCVLRGHTERRRRALSVRSLAATGADMNAVDVLNQTVLHFLVKNRR